MSYKQFIQELEDDISPAEAERRYIFQMKVVISIKSLISISICWLCHQACVFWLLNDQSDFLNLFSTMDSMNCQAKF